MSLDHTLIELQLFHDALLDFAEVLQVTEQDREHVEERLVGLWDDTFRAEFEGRHAEYAAPVADFAAVGVQHYADFVELKISQLRGYLGHGN